VPSLVFSLVENAKGARIEWHGESSLTADDLVRGPSATSEPGARTKQSSGYARLCERGRSKSVSCSAQRRPKGIRAAAVVQSTYVYCRKWLA